MALITVTQKSFASKHNGTNTLSNGLATVTQKSFASKHNWRQFQANPKETVTQKSFASKHNGALSKVPRGVTVTQKSFASKHNRPRRRSTTTKLSHKNHLHQNTTNRLLWDDWQHCHTKIICIKTQRRKFWRVVGLTVTQKSFASKHNSTVSLSALFELSHKNHLHQNTTG